MNELTLPTLYGAMFLALLYFLKGKLREIDDHMKNMQIHQSDRERETLAEMFNQRFTAHEELDDRRERDSITREEKMESRFLFMQQTTNSQFIDIMNELRRKNETRHE